MSDGRADSISLYSILNILIFIFFPPSSNPAYSQETIVLNTAFDSPISNEAQTGFGDVVLREAFERIGYKLETVRLPAERALINANLGIDDGDLLRIGGLQKIYPNLIQVPEKVIDLNLVLFTKNKPSFVVNGWGSLESHTVAIITGWKILESNFGNHVDIIKTDNVNQLFTLLTKNRVDFIGYSRWSGLGFLKENNITDITLLEPPLARTGFYTYLHKKHKKIVPELAAIIKEMKNDGTITATFDRLLKPYMQKKQ